MRGDHQEKAFAMFGSASRGDIDLFSDRDLLIVSDDEVSLREMKIRYDSLGWSSTCYSWNRLQMAADRGSLFVQHLKQEAKIFSDPSDRLACLLKAYSPNVDYKRERDGTASVVTQLIQHLPQCDAGPMWTLDVLSVGFRSLAVADLADHGIYAFSNLEIIDGLSRLGVVSVEEGRRLRDLRRYKSLYRRGVIDRRVDWAFAFDTINLVSRVFGLGLGFQCDRTIQIVELALSESIDDRIADVHWYAKCRRLESALCMLKPRDDRRHAEFHTQRSKLLKLVRAPNTYAWHFSRGYEEIQHSLSELARISAV